MKLFTFICAVVFSTVTLASAVFAGDNKYYSEFVFKHKINDKFDIYFTPELRLREDMGSPYYYHFRVGSTFHAYKNLDLAVAYRYIQTKDSKNEWDKNDTQYVEAIIIPKIKLGNFDLSDANKFERRFIENAVDRWVYRNLLTVGYPAKIMGFEFTPYVSNEVYYDFELDTVNLDWVTAGANKKINKNLTLGLYYRLEISRVGTSDEWVTNNVLGTNVTVNF